ncbi:baculovirus F protein domain-containing protein [Phthorimaea operculella]|nr:baculovirus F protein domain-containing protein [Phthorimaea operculella]
MSPLQNNNTLYFDRITDMNLIRDNWRLIAFYDLQPYDQGMMTFTKYFNYMDDLCAKIHKQSHCEGIMFQLRHEVTELQYYKEILMNHNTDTSPHRQRRGLINGIGYVANSLFGVLDEHFAEKYERDIHLIRLNQKHLSSLWKNQTSVVEAELNVLKRTEILIDKQHKFMNKKINSLEGALNEVKTGVQNISLINDFLTTAMITSNIIQSLKNVQETLLDTVTNIYNGKFNFHILSPDQLRYELGVISEQLPKDLSLPVKKTDSLSELYNLLQVRARVTSKFIIFEITIPLIGEDMYEILKIIPVPKIAENEKEIVVVPISSYVAVSLKKDAFVEITKEDLKSCVHRDPGTTLCHIKRPIKIIKDEQSFCEFFQFTNRLNFPATKTKHKRDAAKSAKSKLNAPVKLQNKLLITKRNFLQSSKSLPNSLWLV